jgi:predicted naringenin-chalcone synthase
MAWKIGDEGFEMVLSSYVPHIIDQHIEGALAPLLARDDELTSALNLALDTEAQVLEAQVLEAELREISQVPGATLSTEIAHWAIHPGGRSILDKTEAKLGLTEAQLVPSRETLRRYGNMSSATILFVLKAILDADTTADAERVCAMAFGPGLTVESGLMTVIAG